MSDNSLVKFHPLGEKARESALEIAMTMYFGRLDSIALAIACAREFDWQLVALFENNKVVHAAVRREEYDRFFDIRGLLTEEQFLSEFPRQKKENICVVTEEELSPGKGFGETDFAQALRYATFFYPDMPWKHITTKHKVMEFAEALTRLSKNYHTWIETSDKGVTHVVADKERENDGYDVYELLLGQYNIRRRLGL